MDRTLAFFKAKSLEKANDAFEDLFNSGCSLGANDIHVSYPAFLHISSHASKLYFQAHILQDV